MAGISPQEYEKQYLLPFAPLAEVLRKHWEFGYAGRNEEGRWFLTPKGYLVSNDIITDLLMAQDRSYPLKRI